MSRPRSISDEQILEAARACFLEQGPGVSTTVIAARLGVSQATLFKRFGTKERLLLAALVPEEPSWVAMLEGGPDERPMPAQLREIGVAIHSFMRELMPMIGCLRAAGLHPHDVFASREDPPPVRAHRALSAWFSQAIEAGRLAHASPDTLAWMFLGSVHIHAFIGGLSADKPALAYAEYLDQLVAQLWRGAAPGGRR